MCVEETLELTAGFDKSSAFYPGIGLQRVSEDEAYADIHDDAL